MESLRRAVGVQIHVWIQCQVQIVPRCFLGVPGGSQKGPPRSRRVPEGSRRSPKAPEGCPEVPDGFPKTPEDSWKGPQRFEGPRSFPTVSRVPCLPPELWKAFEGAPTACSRASTYPIVAVAARICLNVTCEVHLAKCNVLVVYMSALIYACGFVLYIDTRESNFPTSMPTKNVSRSSKERLVSFRAFVMEGT